MKERVGVIGDTHGLVHPRVPDLFKGAGRIIHAGDIGGIEVLDELGKIAPVTAVKGNYDVEPAIQEMLLPDPSGLIVAGLQALISHRLITVNWDTHSGLVASMIKKQAPPTRLFIFGHTHFPVFEEIDGITFVNPGYVGPDLLEGPRSAVLLEIEDGRIDGEIFMLDE